MSAAEPLWTPGPPAGPLDVVGLGQSSLDTVVRIQGPPPFAGKVRARGLSFLPGGQIATAMLACARLGLRCALVGSVGDDAAAEAVLAPLAEAGVELGSVRRIPGAATQSAVILVDAKSGERTVIWQRDPRLSLEVGSLRREEIARGRVLHLDAGDLELSTWAAGVAREAGMAVVLDADTPGPGVERLLRRVDFPIVSREFAETFFGTRSPVESVRGLVALGARFAVVTLGDRGAVGGAGGEAIQVPAFRVPVRDTTGAGDAFHAAFVFGLLEGLGGEEILRLANAAAGMNCRAPGAQGGLPSRDALRSFLAEADRIPEPAGAPGRGRSSER